jgi:hemerythrin
VDTRVNSWSPSIEFGIPDIDDQHRELFQLAATFRGQGDEIRVMKSLAILCDYAKVHLRDEEELLARIGYPDIEAHRQAHSEFRKMLRHLLQDARSLTLDQVADRVEALINGWFYNHIMRVDRLYIPMVVAYKAYQSRPRDTRPASRAKPFLPAANIKPE